MTETIIKFLK